MAPKEGSRDPLGSSNPTHCCVLIAVQPPSFERLIEHLLCGQPGLRVVGGSSKRDSAARAARLAPDVIIASTRLAGREPGSVIAELKRSSPSSMLVLLTQGIDHPFPREAVDARLPEDDVVKRLLPLVRAAQRARAPRSHTCACRSTLRGPGASRS